MKMIIFFILMMPCFAQAQDFMELKQYKLPEARQGVAVDKDHFFVINNSSIVKYNRLTGKEIARWDGTSAGIVKHLNSGIVIKGKLYCANSNYPHSPMASSIEIFDAKTLAHIDTHSFGVSIGSATWIDEYKGHWYVGFANYTGSGSSEGRDHRWTSLAKFTKDWQLVASWLYPDNILQLFAPKSNSGGTIADDGSIYITGHDRPELYVMKLPEIGYMLQHVKTYNTKSYGQGFAIDKSVKNRLLMFGLSRNDNSVIVSELR